MDAADKQPEHKNPPTFDAFRELAAKLVQVPKAEADKKEAAYRRDQKKKPKRGPRPA